MRPTIKASLIALAIASFPFGAQAAGLGQINVLSGLGEALRAEIPINATAQELQSLTARIAQPEAFLQANVAYASFVPAVRVAVENRGGRSVLRLTSHLPVDEPSASLIVEMTWDDGRMMRTYNFLLDPPEMIHRPEPVAPPLTQFAQPPAQEPPVDTSFAPPSGQQPPPPFGAYEPPPESVPQTATAGEETRPPQPPPDISFLPPPASEERYVVKHGDTAGAIARTYRPAGIDRYQMLEALRRNNPSAFIGGNINRIRERAELRIPTADEVAGIDRAEAKNNILMQTREFNEWRQRLADAAGTALTQDETGRETHQVGKGVTEVDNSKQVAISTSLSDSGASPATGAADSSAALGRLQLLEEEIVARTNEVNELQARVKELSGIAENQEKLLALKDQELARLALAQKASEEIPAPESESPPKQEPEPMPEPVPTPEPPPVPEPVPETVAPPPPPRPPVPPPPPQYVDPLAWLTPQTLGIGALVIVLLGGFLGFRSWQRKRADASLETLSQDDESIFPSENTSIFGETGGQSVDTGSSSVIHTDFSQTGLSIDTNEGVDPVAEADVYMAYGRDTQAEEILNDALKADPQRGAIYVKLLEIYVQRHDLAQFESTASELFARTQGQGRDWEKAAQMGRKLDPSNPLYAARTVADDDEEVVPVRTPAVGRSALRDSSVENTGGPQLASLDFSSSASNAYPGQLKDTVVTKDKVDELLPRGSGEVAPPPDSEIDFDLGAAEQKSTAQGAAAAGEVNFDFGITGQKPAAPAGTASRQPAAAPAGTASRQPAAAPAGTASRQPAAAPVGTASRQPAAVPVGTASRQPGAAPVGTASRQPGAAPAGVASRQPGAQRQSSVAATGGVAGDLVAPLEFDLPELERQNTGGGADMTATVVLPPVQGGGDVELDFEKTNFNPHALDFDLDLGTASARNGAATPVVEADMAGEVDTKLELARAYEDMGDSEGALELLREVAAEGNAAQKAAAQALINKLG